MIRQLSPFVLAATVVAAGSSLTACRDVAGLQDRSRVSLSVATPRSSSSTSISSASTSRSGSASGPAATVTPLGRISGNGHVLAVQSADLTVSDIRLDLRDGGGDQDSDSDSDGRHSNDGVFRTGPVTIALPVDGGMLTPLTGEIPFGTYDELEADIEFLRLRGTYDDQLFDATIEIDRELAIRLRPPLVIDADHRAENVTLNVDIGQCFVDRAGTPIDPRRLSTDRALRSDVRDCVKRTLRAFKDRDRDGDDEDSDSDRS